MPFRSILFTPATRLDRLDRALAAQPDWVALDLEDGVGPDAKDAARQALDRYARNRLAEQPARIAVRINSLSSPDGIRDMAAMLDWPVWPGMVVVPKVSSAADCRQIAALAACRGWRPAFLVTLETADGLAAASQIARAAPPGAAIGYGSADHMAETGGQMSEPALAWARGQVVNAAAVAGIPALDGVWTDFRDPGGLKAEAELVRSMGFAGKIAIHPDQIAPIHQVFTPTDAEITTANAILAASNAAGGGAFSFDGKMVDAPVLARARRIAETMDRSVR